MAPPVKNAAYLAAVRKKLQDLLDKDPKGPRAATYRKGLATVKSQQAQLGSGKK